MSKQTETLAVILENARSGNEAAIQWLRDLLRKSADAAPVEDLLTLSECLLRIGVGLSEAEARRN